MLSRLSESPRKGVGVLGEAFGKLKLPSLVALLVLSACDTTREDLRSVNREIRAAACDSSVKGPQRTKLLLRRAEIEANLGRQADALASSKKAFISGHCDLANNPNMSPCDDVIELREGLVKLEAERVQTLLDVAKDGGAKIHYLDQLIEIYDEVDEGKVVELKVDKAEVLAGMGRYIQAAEIYDSLGRRYRFEARHNFAKAYEQDVVNPDTMDAYVKFENLSVNEGLKLYLEKGYYSQALHYLMYVNFVDTSKQFVHNPDDYPVLYKMYVNVLVGLFEDKDYRNDGWGFDEDFRHALDGLKNRKDFEGVVDLFMVYLRKNNFKDSLERAGVHLGVAEYCLLAEDLDCFTNMMAAAKADFYASQRGKIDKGQGDVKEVPRMDFVEMELFELREHVAQLLLTDDVSDNARTVVEGYFDRVLALSISMEHNRGVYNRAALLGVSIVEKFPSVKGKHEQIAAQSFELWKQREGVLDDFSNLYDLTNEDLEEGYKYSVIFDKKTAGVLASKLISNVRKKMGDAYRYGIVLNYRMLDAMEVAGMGKDLVSEFNKVLDAMLEDLNNTVVEDLDVYASEVGKFAARNKALVKSDRMLKSKLGQLADALFAKGYLGDAVNIYEVLGEKRDLVRNYQENQALRAVWYELKD